MSAPTPEFRVLVADPSTHMAGLVTLMLHTLKIRAVDEAGDARHAADYLARRPYQLLLVDDTLGSTADFALIRGLRADAEHINRAVPIIMMTATADAAVIAAAREAGVTELLRKPFSAQHIRMRLDAIRDASAELAGGAPDRRTGDPQKRSA